MTATLPSTSDTPRARGQLASVVDVSRQVWALAGRHRAPLRRCLVIRVPLALLSAVQVLLVVVAIERVRTASLTSTAAWWIAGGVTATAAVQLGLAVAGNRMAWLHCYLFGGELRVRLLDRARALPVAYHSRHQAGETTMVLTGDVTRVENFVGWSLPVLVGDIALPLSVLAVLAVLDLRMAAATALSVVLALPALAWTQRRLAAFTEAHRDLHGQTVARVVEYVQGIAVVRAFNLAGERQASFKAATDALHANMVRLLRTVSPTYAVFTTVLQLGIAVTLAAVAYLLFGGQLDAGTAVVFLVLAVRVYEPLFDIAGQVEPVPQVAASLARIHALLDAPCEPVPTVTRPIEAYDLTLEAVDFSYGAAPVLVDVGFAVPARTMTAIVGPSGAGKSTILGLLARLYRPGEGSVRIGGVDLREVSEGDLYDAVGVVFQDAYLFGGNVRDNIAAGRPDASDDELVAAARAAGCHDDIAALVAGYDTSVGEAGQTLSGGERQRVTLARALLKRAPVLLLDEVTAAVDPSTERVVTEALDRLRATTTIVVVSHRLATVRSADQIVVLDGGRVVGRGTHDELVVAGGLYARWVADRERVAGWRLTSTSRCGD